MGEKDRPNIFNGKQEILLFQVEENPALATPLGEVVADSLTITREDEDTQEDYGKYARGTWNFSFRFKAKRKDKVIMRWWVFGGRKPYGIKYPHKKRKIRVLSKWINRYMHAYNYEK